MASITIKGREEKLQVTLPYETSFDAMMKELHQKLETMQRLSQSNTWEAFFSIPEYYDEMQLYELFSSVAKYDGVIAGFQRPAISSPFDVYEKDIRSGEHLDFSKPTIVFGNIHTDAFVICADDLFVMGKVEGSITLLSKQSTLYAMSLVRANLQIFDEIRPDVTSFAPKKFYYEADK